MPDHRLKPLTPLGQTETQSVTIGPVTIVENVGLALASLATRQGRQADVARGAKLLKMVLPPAGRSSDSALWLGPDQWMIEAPFATHEDIAGYLKATFGDAASITEQTDAWARFDVTGPDLHAMFERLCNLDTRAMKPGCGTRTVIEHLGCYVTCKAEGLTVLGPRSSAKSLFHALCVAAKSAY